MHNGLRRRLTCVATATGAARAACAAIALLWSLPAAAQQSASSGSIDWSRFTLQQSFGYLTTATAKTATTASHAYTGETEIAYNATDWYRIAIAVPGSLTGRTLSWNGVAVRNLFMQPNAGERKLFFGVSVDFGTMPANAAFPALSDTNTRVSAGVTPIVGFHQGGYELLLSPSITFGLGKGGVAIVAPAARLTRAITEDVTVGIEYGGALGQIGAFAAPAQQAHIVYGVSEFKYSGFNLNVGVGYGLTAASNGLAVKLGIGHGF